VTDAERKTAIDAELASIAKHRRRPLAEVREVWGERAAIREALGGLRHRRNAELHAVADTFEVYGAQGLRGPAKI
jgi:hypothetical protein